MLYYVRILHKCILLSGCLNILFVAGVAMAQTATLGSVTETVKSTDASPCDWGANPCVGFVYPNAGAVAIGTTYEGVMTGTPSPHDPTLSTVSYPGNFPVVDPAQRLLLPDNSCYFIINTTVDTAYYVPLRTQPEWTAFSKQVNDGNVPGLSLCNCNNPNCSPVAKAACGPANAVASATMPASTMLCSSGTATAVTATMTSVGNACAASWTWTCTAIDAQLNAPCSAPSLATTTTTTTTTTTPQKVNLGIILDASASMKTFDDATEAAVGAILPTILAQYPNVTLSAVVVLGGNGYTPAVTNAGTSRFGGRGGGNCFYGEVYGAAAPNGYSTANDYGLGSVSDGSSTPLAAAITYTAGYLIPASGVQNAIIMLTDGAETCGGDFTGTVEQEVSSGTKMYGVAYQDASYQAQNFANFTQYWPANSNDLTTSIENALTSAVTDVTTNTISACATTAQNP